LGRQAVKITADTNILVRAVTGDNPEQSPAAERVLAEAELVAVTLPVLCEFCWVLRRAYRYGTEDIARAVRALIAADNVAADEPAVAAGLAVLEQGRDFADGVIAHAGKWLGGETFVSFDADAVRLLREAGETARTPG
jgi:predicted nucleic-acid-binding protein